MNFDKMISEAIEKKAVLELLRGEEGYRVEVSKFTSDVFPTDVNIVLVDCFYNQVGKIAGIDKIFIESFYRLLQGNEVDVYIALLYFDTCIFHEERGKATFKIEKELLAGKIRDAICMHKEKLQNEIVFPNGLKKRNPWNTICNFNKYYVDNYGINIIP